MNSTHIGALVLRYTLLYTPSSLSLSVVVSKTPPYDLAKDFTPIVNVAITRHMRIKGPQNCSRRCPRCAASTPRAATRGSDPARSITPPCDVAAPPSPALADHVDPVAE